MTIFTYFRINLKDVKLFLSKINYKIPLHELRRILSQVNTEKKGEYSFDEFTNIYQKMIVDENVSQ